MNVIANLNFHFWKVGKEDQKVYNKEPETPLFMFL